MYLSKRKIKRGGEGELTIEEIENVLKEKGVKCYTDPLIQCKMKKAELIAALSA